MSAAATLALLKRGTAPLMVGARAWCASAPVKESNRMRYSRAILPLLLIALLKCPTLNLAQQGGVDAGGGSVVTGSLAELKNRRRILLLVSRNGVVDSRGLAETVLKEAYRPDPEARRRYPHIYNLIAQKINKYIRKYQSISAVKTIADADFIVYFNLLEYRRSLGYPYAYGEMFVILNDTKGGRQPRIVWKTRKNSMWVEDAVEDLIRDLKTVRGES